MYLDPGFGSMVIQIVIAGFAAMGAGFYLFRQKIRQFLDAQKKRRILPVNRDSASFRDPSGFVFEQDGVIYRKIELLYVAQYKQLMASGLYQALLDAELMVSHEEIEQSGVNGNGLVIRPEQAPYISYPYEWCFDQYKDAALTTLSVQLLA